MQKSFNFVKLALKNIIAFFVCRIIFQIAWTMNDSSFLVRFSNFFKEIVVYHSELTVQRCSSGTVATRPVLPKKQHLLRSDFYTNNFRWIWFVFEGPHGVLFFCFGLIRIWSMIRHLWRSYKRLLKHRVHIFQHFYCQFVRDPTNLFCGQVLIHCIY